MPVTPQEAARHLAKLQKARDSFQGFVELLHPSFTFPPFQQDLISKLDALERHRLIHPDTGEPVYNLLVTMPPRHSKTTYTTIDFPSYYMLRRPSRYVLSVSYNQELSTTFGRQVRENITAPYPRQAFPTFEPAVPEARLGATDWTTTERGAYFATGMQGSTTGRAANLLIVDDPIKSRTEAESVTERNKAWDYYVSALSTRLQPEVDGSPPIQIVILTRWHPDDLAGRLQETRDWKAGRWLHVNYPAIVQRRHGAEIRRDELPANDPLFVPAERIRNVKPRHAQPLVESALWPERFPLEKLLQFKGLNEREFASLYMQSPYVQGGNILKQSWWQKYRSADPPPTPIKILAVDTAFKQSTINDWSVVMLLGLTASGDILILDLIRERFEYPDLRQRLITENARHRGQGLRGIYIEDAASGQSLIQDLRREAGLSIIPRRVVPDKVSRLQAVTPLIQGGRVYLPDEAPWLDDFLNEAVAFPSVKHDDQVDALSLGLDALSLMGGANQSFGQIDLSDSLYSAVGAFGASGRHPSSAASPTSVGSILDEQIGPSLNTLGGAASQPHDSQPFRLKPRPLSEILRSWGE